MLGSKKIKKKVKKDWDSLAGVKKRVFLCDRFEKVSLTERGVQ